jgi:hypothetical protein
VSKIQVAQKLLVDEVEPEPVVDVAIGRHRHREVAMRKRESAGMALRRVRQSDEDVPRRGDCEENGE